MHKVTILTFKTPSNYNQVTKSLHMAEAICSLSIKSLDARDKIENATIENPYVVKVSNNSYGWVDNGKIGYDEAAKAKAIKKYSFQKGI